MKKILMVGFGLEPGGFTRVVHEIAAELCRHYEVHHLATNLFSQREHDKPWQIYPNDLEGDPFGVEKLRRLVAQIQPDICWILNDFWFLSRYYEVLAENRDRMKSVAYMPLDGKITNPDFVGALQFFDTVVTYNDFARLELERVFASVGEADADFVEPSIEMIPHGIDSETFFPLIERGNPQALGTLRKKLYGADFPHPEGFIVLNANANVDRKCLATTLEGFRLFCQGKPRDVLLHLHTKCGPESIHNGGIDLLERIERLGLEDRVLVTSQRMSNWELNLLYNCCQVGLNTSWGEGWGLISFEQAATGAAQVVPDHTACTELWRGRAYLLPVARRESHRIHVLERSFVHPESVAEALEMFYADRDLLQRTAEQGQRWVAQHRFSWSDIGRRWSALFESLSPEHPCGHRKRQAGVQPWTGA